MQDRLLRTTIDLCYRAHPFYRGRMHEAGLTPGDIGGVDDLANFPLTYKREFLNDPEAFRLEPLSELPLEARVLREVMYTTGTTTGQPAPLYTTTFDYYAYAIQAARAARVLGMGDSDVIANVFPLTPFPMGAYLRAQATAAAIGASMILAHPGRPSEALDIHRGLDEVVRLIERQAVTVIWGVASFVRRILLRAKDLGADFTAVRMCLVTGESISGAMKDDMRRHLVALGSAHGRIVNRYGSTEGTTLIECEGGAGWHNPSPEQIFMETVDVETGERLEGGAPGLLLITHLMRRGTVLLRYALGDVVELDTGPCPGCRQTVDRVVAQPIRTKDLIKIKGTLVNLEALKAALDGMDGLQEYQIIVTKQQADDPFSPDQLVVRAAGAPPQAELERRIAEVAMNLVQIRPVVEVVRPDDIFNPMTDSKPERLVDRRPALGE